MHLCASLDCVISVFCFRFDCGILSLHLCNEHYLYIFFVAVVIVASQLQFHNFAIHKAINFPFSYRNIQHFLSPSSWFRSDFYILFFFFLGYEIIGMSSSWLCSGTIRCIELNQAIMKFLVKRESLGEEKKDAKKNGEWHLFHRL